MPTSSKISNETKKILDQIQAKITLVKGKKLTMQEIIDTLLEILNENEDLIFNKIDNITFPLEREEIDKVKKFPWDFIRERNLSIFIHMGIFVAYFNKKMSTTRMP